MDPGILYSCGDKIIPPNSTTEQGQKTQSKLVEHPIVRSAMICFLCPKLYFTRLRYLSISWSSKKVALELNSFFIDERTTLYRGNDVGILECNGNLMTVGKAEYRNFV